MHQSSCRRLMSSPSLTLELRWLSRPLRSLLLSCATDSAVSAASTPESVFRLRSFLTSRDFWLHLQGNVMVLPEVGIDARMCRGRSPKRPQRWKGVHMLYYAAMFLLFGLVAGSLNWAGIATVATQSSWTLLLSGILLLMIHWVTGRTARVF